PTGTPMWRAISSVNGRLAEPLKSLNRLSSLRLRLRLRSTAGLASLARAAAAVSGGDRANPWGAASLPALSSGVFGPLSCGVSSVVTVTASAFISALPPSWLALGYCSLFTENWLGDQDSNLDKCLQRALSYH